MAKETLNSTFTSVKVHDLYFKPYISELAIKEKVKELGQQLTEYYKDRCPLFISVLNGSFVFTADLVRACDLTSEISFIKIASYDGLSSSGKTQTLIGLTQELEGRDIVVIEDIVDSGRTLHEFLNTLRAQNPASIKVAALLVKPEALEFDLSIDFIGFEIPNAFVIGYGLDYNGLGRNLKAIYQLYDPN
jgi:hypoxanthine phosphoribosyltransferase